MNNISSKGVNYLKKNNKTNTSLVTKSVNSSVHSNNTVNITNGLNEGGISRSVKQIRFMKLNSKITENKTNEEDLEIPNKKNLKKFKGKQLYKL